MDTNRLTLIEYEAGQLVLKHQQSFDDRVESIAVAFPTNGGAKPTKSNASMSGLGGGGSSGTSGGAGAGACIYVRTGGALVEVSAGDLKRVSGVELPASSRTSNDPLPGTGV